MGVTIVMSRYGGVYEPGVWVAFPMNPDEIPPDCYAGDVECANFFAERRGEIGGGDTPQEAYDDLLNMMQHSRWAAAQGQVPQGQGERRGRSALGGQPQPGA
ncbi:hypothetical protein [Nonomuraea sp. NPDC003214]